MTYSQFFNKIPTIKLQGDLVFFEQKLEFARLWQKRVEDIFNNIDEVIKIKN